MYIKCVAVGDGAVGKTCLLVSYTSGTFPKGYEATVHDRYRVNLPVNGENLELDLYDTAGQEDYDVLRPAAYAGTDVFMMCFSVTSPSSFNNVRQKWVPEVRKHCPGIPLVLVGTKADMRADPNIRKAMQSRNIEPVSTRSGQQLANFINAFDYIECAATDPRGLKQVFDTAISAAFAKGRVHSLSPSAKGDRGGGSATPKPMQPPSKRPSAGTRPATRQTPGGSTWLAKGVSVARRLSGGGSGDSAGKGKGGGGGGGGGGGSARPKAKPTKIPGYKVGQPLPGGWKTALDSKSGEIYYYNKILNATSWYPPKGLDL